MLTRRTRWTKDRHQRVTDKNRFLLHPLKNKKLGVRCSRAPVSPAVQRSPQLSLSLTEPGPSALTSTHQTWLLVSCLHAELSCRLCRSVTRHVPHLQQPSLASRMRPSVRRADTHATLLGNWQRATPHCHFFQIYCRRITWTHTHSDVNNTRVNRVGISRSDWVTEWLDDQPGQRKLELCVTPHSYNLQLSHQTLCSCAALLTDSGPPPSPIPVLWRDIISAMHPVMQMDTRALDELLTNLVSAPSLSWTDVFLKKIQFSWKRRCEVNLTQL